VSVTHRHGNLAWHVHSEREYEEHPRPIDNEEIVSSGEIPKEERSR
jgi:hypothetical protein